MKPAITRSVIAVTMYLAAFIPANPVPALPAPIPSRAAAAWITSSGIKWQIEDVHPGGGAASLALDSDGSPHVSYSGTIPINPYPFSLQYTHRVGGQWRREIAGDMQLGGMSLLKLTTTKGPLIAYSPCNPWYCSVFITQKEATGWKNQNLALSITGPSLSMDLDSHDRPHLAYCSGNRTIPEVVPTELKHLYWTGSQWITETVGTRCGAMASIRLDSQDHPRISYYQYHPESGMENGDLQYAGWTGNEWVQTTVDTVGDVGRLNQLVLDSNDRPHIAYSDHTSRALKYTKWNGQAWETWIVDRGRTYAFDSISLAIDSQDRAHIAYSGNLKADYFEPEIMVRYAAWSGQYWSVGNVDLGESPSLALDANDRPHIVFSSFHPTALSYTLKYAHGELVALDKNVFMPFVQYP